MASIYGLFDPRVPLTLENCRYVGKTIHPVSYRLRDHVRDAEQDKRRHVHFWIRSLLREHIEPIIQVIEEFQDGDLDGLNDAEVAWIAKGRGEGWKLTNHSDGGIGGATGYRFTDEQRQELSEIVTQRHIDDPGIAERKRQAQLKRFSNPEERRRTGEQISAALSTKDKSDTWCPECGKGPFRGSWGLTAHYNNDHDREPIPCPDCDEGPFLGPNGLAHHRGHKHFTDNRKEPLMCDCGKGPFAGLHGLGIHRGRFCTLTH